MSPKYTTLQAKQELKKKGSAESAKTLSRFFKTGKGQYGEGDQFIGVSVPEVRLISKSCLHWSFDDVLVLLESKHHEERLLALIILVQQFHKTKFPKERKKISTFYLKHRKNVNNWDLVDLSTSQVIGARIFIDNDNELLKRLSQLAVSKNLWDRRMSIIATFYLIKQGQFNVTLKIAKMHLGDKEDLIHKAAGWMLREIGKRDVSQLRKFLNQYAAKMPRTMLRYAIEKLEEKERKDYLISSKQ